MRTLLTLIPILAIAACTDTTPPMEIVDEQPPVRLVDPLIGTAPSTTISAVKHSEAGNEPKGQTFPAVGVPFGMTNWTPQTQATETKCISPYYYADSEIQGFRASHWMSGSCTQDYGSVTFMPVSGPLETQPVERASRFARSGESASPSEYLVTLDDYDIKASITGLSRSGIFSFEFGRDEPAHIIIEPNSDEGVATINIDTDRNEVSGSNPAHRIYQGWGEPAGFAGHFVARFSKPFTQVGMWDSLGVYADQTSRQGDSLQVGAYLTFDVEPGETVEVQIGTSFTSVDQARANLESEVEDKSFVQVAYESRQAWNAALNKVRIKGGTEEQRRTFYTAMYHSMLLPRTFSDVDGMFSGFAGTPQAAADEHAYYVDFSVWDTYRAVHPLITILDPDRSSDMVRSLIKKAEAGGWLPIFPAWNQYTAAMIGDHVISIIGDAHAKGISGFDAEKAYGYMIQNATLTPIKYSDYVDGKGRRALGDYIKYGFVPLEAPVEEAFHQKEQASRTLEYAYDDYVLAQMAGRMGKTEDYNMLMDRAANYKNVIDPSDGFVKGRHADGRWTSEFDPRERQEYITEGTPFHYTWYVPHDVPGLIEHMGGRDVFIDKLDTLFEEELYWHGNEPSHHVAYMYNYAGAPEKTQYWVREVMNQEYDGSPGGLSGNDDAGQTSAWYVFSALGFYPVCPGEPEYAIGSPLFEEAVIDVGGGKTFTIRANGVSDENRFIRSMTLNGEPYDRWFLDHADIMSGGELVLEMGAGS